MNGVKGPKDSISLSSTERLAELVQGVSVLGLRFLMKTYVLPLLT